LRQLIKYGRIRARVLAYLALLFIFTAAPTGSGGGGSTLTGSQFQIPTFTGTNAASGNANLLTDANNDLSIATNAGKLNIGLTTNGFSLGIRDPNGTLGAAVPTLRATTTNAVTAVDIIPNGAPSDLGFGTAWNDICNQDITNGGANTACVHLAARGAPSGDVDIGENNYGTNAVGKVYIVDGGQGEANIVASFSKTAGFIVSSGLFISSTGGSVPTCSCTGGAPTCTTVAGSTNNRGKIHMTGGTAVTTCTLTFNSTVAPPQSPFCQFTDGNASTTPLAYSAGAVGTTTAVVDFAAATATDIIYMCM